MFETDEVRPRFGQILRSDGGTSPIVFRAVEGEPGAFEALHAGDESPVVLAPDERLSADVLGPGQRLMVRFEGTYHDD